MRYDVDQRVVLLGLVLRRPVGHVGHVMLREDAHGVVAEAGLQRGQTAGQAVVNPELENSRTLRRYVVSLHELEGEQRSGGKGQRGQGAKVKAGECHKILVRQSYHAVDVL